MSSPARSRVRQEPNSPAKRSTIRLTVLFDSAAPSNNGPSARAILRVLVPLR